MADPFLLAEQLESSVIEACHRLLPKHFIAVLWGLAADASFVFLFRQFFRTLPMELEEATLLDGCGWVHTWRSIFLPLSKPVMAACFILTFVQAWGDFIGPQLFLRNDTTTLAVAVATDYVDPQSTLWWRPGHCFPPHR